MYVMRFWLIPLDHALPALQAHLADMKNERLDCAEAATGADLLARCIKTGEELIAFAHQVGGQQSAQ